MGVLNIGGLAKIVGMNVHTIRAWERRYKALVPERTPSGQRTYNLEDVEKLKTLKHLNEMGMPISQIAKLNISELKLLEDSKSVLSTQIKEKEQISSFQASASEVEVLTQNIISALQRYDVDAVNNELTKYRKNMGAKDFILKVLSPLYQLVGRLVLELKLDIAQEHILSAITRNQMSFLLDSQIHHKTPLIGLTTPEGDLHEFGIIMSHVLCASNDLKPFYMGTNMPLSSLVSVTNHVHLDILILGCTAQNLGYERHNFETYISEFMKQAGHLPEIWVGGKSAALLDVEKFSGKVRYIPNLHILDEELRSLSAASKHS